MQSLASLMSVKPTDIGNLDDFNESDEEEDKKSMTATGRRTYSCAFLSNLPCNLFPLITTLTFPFPLSCGALLFSFLTSALVPHTLTRPNRPAPPPPDKRNSTGGSFSASGISILPLLSLPFLLQEQSACGQKDCLLRFCCSFSHTSVTYSAVHPLWAFEYRILLT